jgi:hypothetical protein
MVLGRVPAVKGTLSRPSFIGAALAACATLQTTVLPTRAADDFSLLSSRLRAPILQQPNFSPSPGEPPLPGWLVGDWACTQTLVGFSTPLGVQYIGAAGRPIAEAEASAQETRRQLGRPISLELRFSPVQGGAREDRSFNTRARLDAFAGQRVVREASACAAAGQPNSRMDLGGQPAACTFVEFLGPVSQKVLSLAHGASAFTPARPFASCRAYP